jgi:tRNA-2-methylthio-N6-dimethylallyladenosine synthase
MPRFAVTTFGCQMNQHDSERLEEVLRGAGWERCAGAGDADLVVVNTCSVREKAEQKLRSEVGRLAKMKRARPAMLLVVAGCVAQQEGERLLGRMPAVDLVLGPDNIPELPALLRDLELGAPPRARTVWDVEAPRFLTAPTVATARPTAFVTTMKGCDERCSFCIVPYTRGPERYRPSDEIVAEVAWLVARGVREVTLLGQTVNSYRDPGRRLDRAVASEEGESEFAALLRAIAAGVPDLLRLRYTSPHPRHLGPSLVAAHRDLAVLPRHVHLPVQSGSDRLLKRMIRRHTRAEYVERVALLRAAVPEVTVSTDVIVGFPGETEADFVETLSLVDEVGFFGVFGFKYSRRPYTPALKLGDDVAEPEKAARLARLFERSELLVAGHLAALVGTRQEVLCEGPSKSQPDLWSGRTMRNEIVHVEGADLDLGGTVASVEIVAAYKHSLRGRLDDADRRRARPRERGRWALPLVGPEAG